MALDDEIMEMHSSIPEIDNMPPKGLARANQSARDRPSSQGDQASAVDFQSQSPNLLTQTPAREQTPSKQAAPKVGTSKPKRTRMPSSLPACQKRIRKQEDQLKSQEVKLKKLEERCKSLQESKLKLSNERKEREQKCHESEENLKKLQDERLENTKSHELTPMTDDEVDTDLGGVFEDTRTFSGRWTVESWTQVDQKQHSTIVAYLETASSQALCSQRMKHAVQKSIVAPKVLLNTILNAVLCDQVFSRPFAYLRDSGTKPEDDHVEKVLEWLARIATETDGGRIIVNARMHRAIEMPFATECWRREASLCSEAIQQLRIERCSFICGRILQQFSSLLQPLGEAETDKCRKSLTGIIERCLKVSCRQALQFSCIKMHFWHTLQKKEFTVNNKELQPHRGMKLKESEEDEEGRDPRSVEGSLVDMVIEPLVVRRGDTGGRHPNIVKNIRKAVVWVVAPETLGHAANVSGDGIQSSTSHTSTSHRELQSDRDPIHHVTTPQSSGKQGQIDSYLHRNPRKHPVVEISASAGAGKQQSGQAASTTHVADNSVSDDTHGRRAHISTPREGRREERGSQAIKMGKCDEEAITLSSGDEGNHGQGQKSMDSPLPNTKKRNRQSHSEKTTRRRSSRAARDSSEDDEWAGYDSSGEYDPGTSRKQCSQKRPKVSKGGQARGGPGDVVVRKRGCEGMSSRELLAEVEETSVPRAKLRQGWQCRQTYRAGGRRHAVTQDMKSERKGT